MADSYCSVGDVPKGRKRGTMKECAEKNQIRYYGLKKIDSKILDSMKKKKSAANSEKELRALNIKLTGKVQRLLKDLKREKDTDKKDAMKDKARIVYKELKDVQEKIKKLSKKSKKKSKKIKKSKGGAQINMATGVRKLVSYKK